MGNRERYRVGDVALGRHTGHWIADYTDAGTRKRARLIPLTRPEGEARIALARFADARRAVQAQQQAHTCGGLWRLWLAERAKDGKSNEIHAHNWKALSPFFDTRAPSTLTSDDCRAYAKARFDLGRAPDTVHTELIRLRQCLAWAADQNIIPRAPKVWVPQAGRRRDRVLTQEEAVRLVRAAQEHSAHLEMFVILLFATGARHKAVLELTWDRVDFAANTIDLDVDLPPDPMSKSWRKGRAKVVMGSRARLALESARAGALTPYVIEFNGKPVQRIKTAWTNVVKRARLAGRVTPHTIRHTVATWADAANVDMRRTAQMLGHRDVKTTELRYTHARPESTRAAVEVVDVTLRDIPELPRMVGPKQEQTECKSGDVVTATRPTDGDEPA